MDIIIFLDTFFWIGHNHFLTKNLTFFVILSIIVQAVQKLTENSGVIFLYNNEGVMIDCARDFLKTCCWGFGKHMNNIDVWIFERVCVRHSMETDIRFISIVFPDSRFRTIEVKHHCTYDNIPIILCERCDGKKKFG